MAGCHGGQKCARSAAHAGRLPARWPLKRSTHQCRRLEAGGVGKGRGRVGQSGRCPKQHRAWLRLGSTQQAGAPQQTQQPCNQPSLSKSAIALRDRHGVKPASQPARARTLGDDVLEGAAAGDHGQHVLRHKGGGRAHSVGACGTRQSGGRRQRGRACGAPWPTIQMLVSCCSK